MLLRRAGLVVLIAVVAVAATAIWRSRSDGGSSAASPTTTTPALTTTRPKLKPADPTPSTATPARWEGPQGRTGQFVVTCLFSHSASDDPIVYFGQPGASHRHDFYGSKVVNASTPAAQLTRFDTTCNKSPDTAAYWHPSLYDRGRVVTPVEVNAYYRAAPGVDPEKVRTFPLGLSMIAGDHEATAPQPGEATGWTCGSRSALSDTPPVCPSSAPLHLVLTFQDCWDGRFLDSVDHRSHVDYSTKGVCPASHPVHIPQLTTSFKFPIYGSGHVLTLSSGSIYSAHGDFFNGWQPAGLRREIDHCIKRGAVCDLASNREEEDLFAYQP